MSPAIQPISTGPSPRGRLRRPRPYEGISLGPWSVLLINLFTLADAFNALTDRRFFRDRPYAYAVYLKRWPARTFREKMRVIWAAKEDKTRKIIYARQRYGHIPGKVERVCKKTPCGYLRLWAAQLHH